MSTSGELTMRSAHCAAARSVHLDARDGDVQRERARPSGYRVRMLRLEQVMTLTGLRKTKIYELQSTGHFPMRIKLTAHSVGWVEEEIQAWLSSRIATSTPLRLRRSEP